MLPRIPTAPATQRPFPAYYPPTTKLMDVLVIEEALLEIVHGLCYEEVIIFSLTCKAVREQVFPPFDLEYRVPKLKKACCAGGDKGTCVLCQKIVCSVSLIFMLSFPTHTSPHLTPPHITTFA
jgi:hypothetical protein